METTKQEQESFNKLVEVSSKAKAVMVDTGYSKYAVTNEETGAKFIMEIQED